MSRRRIATAAPVLAGACACAALVGCTPGPLNVPPKLGISRVDKDASELEIHAPQDQFQDSTAETLVEALTDEMTEGAPAAPDGKPARFRVRIAHDYHVNVGMVILIAIPVIDLIIMPILSATKAEMGTCDDTAKVDVQVGGRFYHSEVTVNDKGWVFGHDQVLDCAHHVMQSGLDTLKPVDHPPRSVTP